MSHANITIPITAEFSWQPKYLQDVLLRDYLKKNPEAAEFRFIKDKTLFRLGSVDPWELRRDFLSWPLDDWKDFIAAAGGFDRFSCHRVSKEDFEQLQKLLREALIRPAQGWKSLGPEFQIQNPSFLLSEQPNIFFVWNGKIPQAFIRPQHALQAMIATIQIDKLRGAEFRVCARHDCKNPPFRVEARNKIYCSIDCAHLVAVRNSRKRAQERTERKRK
jgi:hypothetical protein